MEISIEKLQEVFNQSFENCPPINSETNRTDIPSWDSMSHLNLILNLEEMSGHGFSMEEIESIKGVQDILNILTKA